MDYNKLMSFITVAENRSLAIAAKVLRRTQSSITEQLKTLEEELQTKLIEQVGKQIILTPEGQQIFDLAKEKLGDIDIHVDRVISKGQTVKGTLNIGLLSYKSTPFPFYKTLGNFKKNYPDIRLEVKTLPNIHLEKELLNESLDFGFLTEFEQRNLFHTIQTSTASLIPTTSWQYLERKGPFQAMDDILNANLIDCDLNLPHFRGWLRKNSPSLVEELIHKTPDLIVPDLIAAKMVIEEGYGIAVLPEHLTKENVRQNKLIHLLPQMKGYTIWQELGYCKSKILGPHEQAFVDFIKSHTV